MASANSSPSAATAGRQFLFGIIISAPFALVEVEEFRWKLTKICAPASAAALTLFCIHPEPDILNGHAAVVRVIYTLTPSYFSNSSLQ